MLAPSELAVTISLYWVKRRNHGGSAAAGGSTQGSTPGPPTTFMLGGRKGNWRASLWLSASCRWSCWPYSQPRTGVVNRYPGIVSDRTPLAHVHIVHAVGSLNSFEKTKQNAICLVLAKDYVGKRI
jgi:hypothetical protein